MKIIVLGAGIIGVTTAYFLSSAGHEVFVIDKAKSPGLATSFANGGQLSYSYTDALANPALVAQLPKLFKGQEPAFDMKWAINLFFWGLRFLRNCTKSRAAFNTENILRLSMYSREMIHQILALHSIEFNYQQNGKLHLYSSEQTFNTALQYVKLKNDWGCQQEILSPQTCRIKEPSLEHFATKTKIVGGIFSPKDESGNSYLFTTALADLCVKYNNVQFLYETEITALEVKKGRIYRVKTADDSYYADAFVVCLGAESPLLCQTIGIKLPIYPIKGYSLILPATASAPTINITDTHHKMIYCTLGDKLRIAGMLEMCGYDTSINEIRLKNMIQTAQTLFPEAGDFRQIMPWAGLRAGTPDSAPIIGWTRYPNLYLNTGHTMLGWTLAAGSAAVVADIINDSSPAIDLTGLTLKRF